MIQAFRKALAAMKRRLVARKGTINLNREFRGFTFDDLSVAIAGDEKALAKEGVGCLIVDCGLLADMKRERTARRVNEQLAR